MEDQALEPGAGALVPMDVALAASDDRGVGDQPGVLDQGRAVRLEQGHRIPGRLEAGDVAPGNVEGIEHGDALTEGGAEGGGEVGEPALGGDHQDRAPIAASDGELLWRSSLIRIDSWHLSQVEAVLVSFWTAIGWVAGITLLGLSLVSAWWLGKRRAIACHGRQQVALSVQHLAVADDDGRPRLPARIGNTPAALPDAQEQDQPVEQMEEPDIEGLFRQVQGLEAWEETRPRKPVAKRKWDHRPC